MKYLDVIKHIVKKSRWGSYFFSPFPKSLLYTPVYNNIVHLCRQKEAGKLEIVDIALRKRMKHVLEEALLHIPWYRDNVGIDPQSITLENVYEKLAEFPYLTKQIVMNNWNSFINEKYSVQQLKTGSTEGTTGQGILIASSRREIGMQKAFHEYWMRDIHFDFLKTRILRIGLEGLRDISMSPIQRSGNRLLVSPVHLVKDWFKPIYDECVKFSPEVIHSYPTLLYLFARYINENNLPPIKVQGLLLTSDVFLFNHYMNFKKAFGNPRIYGSYNMSEHVALGKAMVDEGNKTIGYQLDNLYAYNENLKDKYGNYEIVGTSYWNEAMPFIRYRTQDFGKINNEGFIKSLDGRGQTFLTTKKGDKIAGISILALEDYVWNYVEAIQFVQHERGKLIIRIIPRLDYTDGIGKKIILDIEQKWPGLFDYEIHIVEEITKGRSTKVNSIIVDMNE